MYKLLRLLFIYGYYWYWAWIIHGFRLNSKYGSIIKQRNYLHYRINMFYFYKAFKKKFEKFEWILKNEK